MRLYLLGITHYQDPRFLMQHEKRICRLVRQLVLLDLVLVIRSRQDFISGWYSSRFVIISLLLEREYYCRNIRLVGIVQEMGKQEETSRCQCSFFFSSAKPNHIYMQMYVSRIQKPCDMFFLSFPFIMIHIFLTLCKNYYLWMYSTMQCTTA